MNNKLLEMLKEKKYIKDQIKDLEKQILNLDGSIARIQAECGHEIEEVEVHPYSFQRCRKCGLDIDWI